MRVSGGGRAKGARTAIRPCFDRRSAVSHDRFRPTIGRLSEASIMIPGEIVAAPGEIVLNEGQPTLTLEVANTGDRPVQVGSHYHFAETNAALAFDRAAARGMRLDIAAGTAVRFEPGQRRVVTLVPLRGRRRVYGFNGKVMGAL